MSDLATIDGARWSGVARPPSGGLRAHIAALLDTAHAELGARELAGVLLEAREWARDIAEGALPPPPPEGASRATAPLLVRLRFLLLLAIAQGGDGAEDDARHRDIAAWLAERVEEVASRPCGAAVPVG